MKVLWLTAATVAAVVVSPVQAAQTASDVADAWTSPAGCFGGLVARSAGEAGTVYNVGDDGQIRVAQVEIRVAGDRLSIIDDRKVEYYRIVGPDKVEYVGYDTRASVPAARSHPAASSTCG